MFLGLTQYYREYIYHFAEMAKPLYEVLKHSEKDTEVIQFTPEETEKIFCAM